LRYEKPKLVELSQKAFGDVQDQGTCASGTSPGTPTPINACVSGFNANPAGYCTQGTGVH
jgi:hypothetical protein